MMNWFFSIFSIIVVSRKLSNSLASSNISEGSLSSEHRLHDVLFAPGRYAKDIRPVTNHSKAINVRLGMCISAINDILERQQTLVTSGCIRMRWNDEFLRWSPEEFKNQSWFALPSNEIWIPDVALINSPDPYRITRKRGFAEVSNNGDVGYYPSGLFTTRCSISMSYFPFDVQRCSYVFESWIYPNDHVLLEPFQPDAVDMAGFQISPQWELEEYVVNARNQTYDGISFSEIRFHLYFRRRTLYYRLLVILPTLLMTALQCFSHTIAVEHSGRMALLMTLFLATFVLQSSLASQMPKSSEGVTLIQVYQMIFSGSLVVSIFITMMIMHVTFRVPFRDKFGLSRLLWAYFIDTGKKNARNSKQLAEKEISGTKSKPGKIENVKAALPTDKEAGKGTSPMDLKKTESSEPVSKCKVETQVSVYPPPESGPEVKNEKTSTCQEDNARPSFEKVSDASQPSTSDIPCQEPANPILKIENGDKQSIKRQNSKTAGEVSTGDGKVKQEPQLAIQPPSALTDEQRKERWLQFGMLIDKIFLYVISVLNIVCPVILFAIVPQFQRYHLDDDDNP